MPDHNGIYFLSEEQKNEHNYKNLEKQSPGSEREKKGTETRCLS